MRWSSLLRLVAATDEVGTLFLTENAAKDDVVTTTSGLQYKVIQSGQGVAADEDSTCTAHYRGTLVDGTVFDSSYDRGMPLVVKPSQVIKGWGEALQMMKEGDKWELFIPSELGYGATGAGDTIPPNAALVFEVELLKVEEGLDTDTEDEGPSLKTMFDDMARIANETLEASAARPDVVVHETGLQYRVLRSGDDDARRPAVGTRAEINYEQTQYLKPDVVVDSTYERGESEIVSPDEVLIGMKIAIGLMKEGDKWELVLPAALAYGVDGAKGVPPHAVMKVALELVSVKDASPRLTALTDIATVNVSGFVSDLGEDLACHACIYTGRLLRKRLEPMRGGKKKKKRAEIVMKAFKTACRRENLPSSMAIHEHNGKKLYTDWREMMQMGKMWDAVELESDEKHAADILRVCKELRTGMGLGLAKGAAQSDDRVQKFDYEYWMCGPTYTNLCPAIFQGPEDGSSEGGSQASHTSEL
mmetsp:Transcript_123534/g.283274  ORF Transcript_123534/g.283274 Transcript_123534/m.283274 type:complete len:474 (+) Transcript_123534:63-1484(+)